MVCFGNMFVELPKARAKEMMQKGTETPIRMERSRVTLPCGAGFWRCPKVLTEAGCCHRHTALGTYPRAHFGSMLPGVQCLQALGAEVGPGGSGAQPRKGPSCPQVCASAQSIP